MSEANGYNSDFLGVGLSLPKVDTTVCVPLLNGNGFEIKYKHFSLFQHQLRRFPVLAATNIKGEAYSAATREGNEPWNFSDQISDVYQIDNGFYGKDDNTFDRGHIVRRVDPCWGTPSDSKQAEKDTFNWANCTPQHKKLNQKGGIWFQLEQHVMEHGVKNKIADISVFAGPVLDPKDLIFYKPYKNTNVQIPIAFWKVIVWKKSDGKLYAVGFMMSQWEFVKSKLINGPLIEKARMAVKEKLADSYFENLKFEDHKTYQVSIKAIEKATGIKFAWRNVSLPFKAQQFKEIVASPLRNVHPYAAVFESKTKLAETKTRVTVSDFKQALSSRKSISPATVQKMKSKGEGYTLKRYEIKNITL